MLLRLISTAYFDLARYNNRTYIKQNKFSLDQLDREIVFAMLHMIQAGLRTTFLNI